MLAIVPTIISSVVHDAARSYVSEQEFINATSDSDPHSMEPQLRFETPAVFELKPVWQAMPVPRFEIDKPGRWHSKGSQDRLVHTLLGRQRGFFVDLAANHPVFISNTRALERDFNWTGLCIEANPRYWTLLRAVRNCHVVGVAVANTEGVATFVDHIKGGFGGLDGPHRTANASHLAKAGLLVRTFNTRTKPFDKLLAETGAPKIITYLSLDVENAEPLVMESFPFATHRFTLMTIESPESVSFTHFKETTRYQAQALKKMMARLRNHGYRRLCRLGSDDVWVDMGAWLNKTAVSRIVSHDQISRCEPIVGLPIKGYEGK